MGSRWIFGGALVWIACSSSSPPLADEASGESGATSGSQTGGESSVDAPDFPEPTTGPDLACDPYQQDCPAGEKCTHYNSEGSNEGVDATKCVPLPDPVVPTGGICMLPGGLGAGQDNCGVGDFCYFLGGDEVGVCVPLCDGSSADPMCPEGSFCAHGLGPALYFCLQACDPLAQDCLEGSNCNPTDEGFVCALDTSGEGGQIYDPCEAANGCDPGLMCGPPTGAPECPPDELGCCLPMCEVGGTLCPDPLECSPLYDATTHPELASYGVCAASDAGEGQAASLAASLAKSGPAAR